MNYSLSVSYKMNQDNYMDMYSKDRKLEKILGRSSDGAGFCFGTAERDISWSWKTLNGLKKAYSRIKPFKRSQKLKDICAFNLNTNEEIKL